MSNPTKAEDMLHQNRWVINARIVVRTLFLLAVLFGCAGTIAWVNGWVAVGMYAVFFISMGVWLKRHDPDLLRERTIPETKKGRPAYDIIFTTIYKLVFLSWLCILGLDAVRFGWSNAPLWVSVTGGVILLISFVILYFVIANNSYLAREVRIQAERDHEVVSSGPYGIVRHPMYSAIGLMFLGKSLLLGSYVGVCIGIVMTLMLCFRCVLEEGTLVSSLKGYDDYKNKVRFRILPGVW